jgi:hypothetical protein
MDSGIITVRCGNKKAVYFALANKNDLDLSKYIKKLLDEQLEMNGFIDGEKKFLKLFEIAFETYYEPYYDKIMRILNIISIDIKTVIEQNNIMYKYLDFPQEKGEIKMPLYNHPITDLAKEKVLQNLRSKLSNKVNQDA